MLTHFSANRHTQRLNDSAIQLVLQRMEASTRTYDCRLKKKDQSFIGVDHDDVYIGYPPANVTNFKCRSPNWQSLSCTFDKPYNPALVTYTLYFGFPEDPQERYACLDLSDNTCLITSGSKGGIYRPHVTTYLFKLEMKNELGNASQEFRIDHFSIVVPDMPFNAKASNITSTSALLSWQRPQLLKMFEKCKHLITANRLQNL